jgi:hypothetical protein
VSEFVVGVMSVPADPKVFEKRERVPVSGGVTVITIEPEKGSNPYRCPICAPPQCAFPGSRSDPADVGFDDVLYDDQIGKVCDE